MKNLMLPYMMLASGMMNPEVNEFNSINSPRINVKPEWERKKCKSCNQWCKYDNSQGCSIKPYKSPNQQACDKYEKRR